MHSPRTAAAWLGLSVGRVRQLIAAGAIRAVYSGYARCYEIEEDELERFAALDRPAHRPRKEIMNTPDTRTFHALIEQRDWYEAAVLLLRVCETRGEDPQDWLSHGDSRHMLGHTIEEIAAEWDAYCAS